MKIIGIADSFGSRRTYIAEVTHKEIELCVGKYRDLDKMDPDDEVDLATGPDLYKKIQEAFRETREFVREHQKIINAIMEGLDYSLFLDEEKGKKKAK